jgi:hypothetical protein
LSKSEIIFYYHRLSKEGIFYELFKEFQIELVGAYHPLPLVRPTRSDAEATAEKLRKAKEIIDLTHEASKSSLTRPEDILSEQPLTETISRNGVDRTTIQNDKHVLWIPPTKKKKINNTALPKVTNKRKKNNQPSNVGSSGSSSEKVSASTSPNKRMKKDACKATNQFLSKFLNK